MYMKFGRSKIFALFLALLAAFFVTGTAMAATVTVGGVAGDNVANASNASGDWALELTFYNTNPTPTTSFTISPVSGTGFGGGATVNFTFPDTINNAGWTISPTSTAIGSGEFSGRTFTLSGPDPSNGILLLQAASGAFSDQIRFNITNAAMKDLSLAVSPTKLTPSVGVSFAADNVVTVTDLMAGDASISPFTLSTLAVRDSAGNPVTSWNGLNFIVDADNKTVTVTGTASSKATANFSLYATSPQGTIEVLTDAFTIDTADTGQAMVISPDIARFYIGVGRTRTLQITAPAENFASLSTSPTSWRGFTIVPDAANKRITVTGTATLVDATSVDVYATNASGDVITGKFSIVAMEPTGPNKLSLSKIGIWDYGNVAMMARELDYYSNVGTNTGYNVGGKYDLLFYSSAIMEGSQISVYLKEPDSDRFVMLPRLRTTSIPLEAWYYVNKDPQPSPYTAPPRGAGGSSFGWYRDDMNETDNTMVIAVNSQPYMTGDYTFRFEYVYTDEYDEAQTNYQDITVRCSDPIGGSSGGGGCDAGVGLMAALGLLSVGGFVIVNKRKR